MLSDRVLSSLSLLVLLITACAVPNGQHRIYASAGGEDQQLSAAERELEQSDPEDARAALRGIEPQRLDARQKLRYQLLQADIALTEDKPLVAQQMVPPAESIRDAELAIRAEAIRARALFRMGDAVAATEALLRRERLLTDPAQLQANRELLWNGLRSADLDTASGLRLAQADTQTRGWVELAIISRSVWLNPRDLQARLEQWRAQFPGHPADERIGAIPMLQDLRERRPLENLALLLPLSGPYMASAEAVRDGFLAAFFNAKDNRARRPSVRIYDTGSTPETLLAAYSAALDEGAEFLVGPLTREDVIALADTGRPSVPVLALNYLDPGREVPFNFFQWGLAPEDEARQAAERAVSDHQYRAVTLVPEGDWGARVQQAFRERLESLGGTVVGARSYSPSARDHSQAIRAVLALDMSEERHRALTSALGVKTEFQPRRREDVDLIFIAARPDQAKLLGPQLRFHRSGELPVYATSLVYDGEAPAADLNGLRFCDMPWMLAQDGEWAALRSQLRTQFPTRPRDYARLLALGHDAYTLVLLIESGQLQPGSFFPAASGTLTLRQDGVISRGLACAEIRNGALKPLDVSIPPSTR